MSSSIAYCTLLSSGVRPQGTGFSVDQVTAGRFFTQLREYSKHKLKTDVVDELFARIITDGETAEASQNERNAAAEMTKYSRDGTVFIPYEYQKWLVDLIKYRATPQ